MPSSSAVRSCCGLWLHVCSWCSESAKISGRKLNNHVHQCTNALVNNNGYLFSAVFSALKNYLKPSAWFNDVLRPALQSKKFTKYGLQWEDHWRYKDAVFCGGPTACTEEVFPSDRA